MSILKINNLSHTFEDKQLFKNASFDINNGEHVGIVGLNGAGKSTFINIIAGNISYDAGEVIWLSGIRYDYLDQHADIDRTKTVFEYLKTAFAHLYETESRLNALYAEMADAEGERLEKMIDKSNRLLEQLDKEGFYEIDSRIKKVAGGLGVAAIGYDRVIGELSGGQRAKVMLSKLILENPDVMLLDEPTNFLDVEHIEWLEKYLWSLKQTYMVISHDEQFLDAVCDHIVSIENGSIRKYTGNYTQFTAQHDMAVKQYAEDYERQQAEIKKMEDYIKTNRFDTISILFNNAFETENISICGTRGWFYDAEADDDKKVVHREAGRLVTSIEAALKTGKEPIAFLHYPPVFQGRVCEEIMNVLLEYKIKLCCYGHIHGANAFKYAYQGNYKGVELRLVSGDYLGFVPKLISKNL